MSDLNWLTIEQMAKLAPYFRKSQGKPRVDAKSVFAEIIFINGGGLGWRDDPESDGLQKTHCSRWKHWNKTVFSPGGWPFLPPSTAKRRPSRSIGTGEHHAFS